jgi:hypothetical protein
MPSSTPLYHDVLKNLASFSGNSPPAYSPELSSMNNRYQYRVFEFRSNHYGSDANPLTNGDDLTTFSLHSDAFSEYHGIQHATSWGPNGALLDVTQFYHGA